MERTTSGVINLLNAQLEEGVDGILGSNDFYYNRGPMFSPSHFHQYIYPYMKEIVDVCHKKSTPYVKQLDGKTMPILDQLIYEVGIDGYHSIDPSAGMNIRLLKKKYGSDITLLGNVDCAQLLVNGTQSEIEEVVKGLIRDIACGGGYIISSSNSIHASVPVNNFRAILNTVKNYGKYPISILK
jgi:uroporphyrinogen decarboxylase